jgi:hypothetical protein
MQVQVFNMSVASIAWKGKFRSFSGASHLRRMRQQIRQEGKTTCVVDSIPRVAWLGKAHMAHVSSSMDGPRGKQQQTKTPEAKALVSMRHVRHVFMARV